MKKLYDKSVAGFVAVAIIVLIAAMTVIFGILGENSIFSLLIIWPPAALYTWFIGYNGFRNRYGYFNAPMRKDYLFYVPLFLVGTVNLWFGFSLNYSVWGQIVAIVVLGVLSYFEEMVFRGLLFKTLVKKNLIVAVIVSSLLFGIDCIYDFVKGDDMIFATLKLVSAIAIGYAVTMIVVRSGSIIPGVIFHCVFSMVSTFRSTNYGAGEPLMWNVISTVFVVLVAGGYGLFLTLRAPKDNTNWIKEVVTEKNIKYVKYSKKGSKSGRTPYQKHR